MRSTRQLRFCPLALCATLAAALAACSNASHSLVPTQAAQQPSLDAAVRAPEGGSVQPSTLTWVNLKTSTAPSARLAPAMAFDRVSKKIVLFGGVTGTAYPGGTWTFDGTHWQRVNTAVAPPARAAAGMAYDEVTKKLVLFGGFKNGTYYHDTWIWDGAAQTWTQAHPTVWPEGVTGPAVLTDPSNGHAFVFGGYGANGLYSSQTYRWTGSNWAKLSPATPPYGRSAVAAATDPLHHFSLVFGGLADINPNNTWEWNGTQWTEESPAAQPEWKYDAGAAYDPMLQQIVVFGGADGGVDSNDTWAWNGATSTWHQLHPAQAPSARESFGMAYDAAIGHVVLFGGQNGNTLYNDTWQLTP